MKFEVGMEIKSNNRMKESLKGTIIKVKFDDFLNEDLIVVKWESGKTEHLTENYLEVIGEK